MAFYEGHAYILVTPSAFRTLDREETSGQQKNWSKKWTQSTFPDSSTWSFSIEFTSNLGSHNFFSKKFWYWKNKKYRKKLLFLQQMTTELYTHLQPPFLCMDYSQCDFFFTSSKVCSGSFAFHICTEKQHKLWLEENNQENTYQNTHGTGPPELFDFCRLSLVIRTLGKIAWTLRLMSCTNWLRSYRYSLLIILEEVDNNFDIALVRMKRNYSRFSFTDHSEILISDCVEVKWNFSCNFFAYRFARDTTVFALIWLVFFKQWFDLFFYLPCD